MIGSSQSIGSSDQEQPTPFPTDVQAQIVSFAPAIGPDFRLLGQLIGEAGLPLTSCDVSGLP